MRRPLRTGFQRFEIFQARESKPDDTLKKFPNKTAALNFVNRLMRDGFNKATLRNMIKDNLPCTSPSRTNDRAVLEQVATQLVSGHLKVAALPIRTPVWRREDAREEEKTPVMAATQEDLAWINLRIVDDETNRPVEGVEVIIKLPSGEIKKFTTNSNGTIEVKGVLEGTWDIQEILDAEGLEVVEVS